MRVSDASQRWPQRGITYILSDVRISKVSNGENFVRLQDFEKKGLYHVQGGPRYYTSIPYGKVGMTVDGVCSVVERSLSNSSSNRRFNVGCSTLGVEIGFV